MLEGTVKWFDEGKKYGFIKVKGESEDIFVHLKDVKKSGYDKLYKKDIVEFKVIEDPSGRKRAIDITAYEPI